jgi:hypothetical protein
MSTNSNDLRGAPGYWRLALITLVLEFLHFVLVGHWPEMRGSRLGPRPAAARVFMLLELIALFAALAAAIGATSRLFGQAVPPKGKILAIASSALVLLGLFFLIWEY